METAKIIEVIIIAKAYLALFTFIMLNVCILSIISLVIPVKNAIFPIWVRGEEKIFPGLVARLKDDHYSTEDTFGIVMFLKLALLWKLTSLKELGIEAKDLTRFILRAKILKMAKNLTKTKNKKRAEKMRLEIEAAIKAQIVTRREIF